MCGGLTTSQCTSSGVRTTTQEGVAVTLRGCTGLGVNLAYVECAHLCHVQSQMPNSRLFHKGRRHAWARPYADGSIVIRRTAALLRQVARWHPDLGTHHLKVTAHSLRTGGASWAEEREVPLPALMAHGRWHSDAVFVYWVQASLS